MDGWMDGWMRQDKDKISMECVLFLAPDPGHHCTSEGAGWHRRAQQNGQPSPSPPTPRPLVFFCLLLPSCWSPHFHRALSLARLNHTDVRLPLAFPPVWLAVSLTSRSGVCLSFHSWPISSALLCSLCSASRPCSGLVFWCPSWLTEVVHALLCAHLSLVSS
jgi:hypothetical protein